MSYKRSKESKKENVKSSKRTTKDASPETEVLKVTKKNKPTMKKTTSIQANSAHQCLQLGLNREFLDEMDYLFEGIKDNQPEYVRCVSVNNLASRLLEKEFMSKVRAHNITDKVFDSFESVQKEQIELKLCILNLCFVMTRDCLHFDFNEICLDLVLSAIQHIYSQYNSPDTKKKKPTTKIKKLHKSIMEIHTKLEAPECLVDNCVSIKLLALSCLVNLSMNKMYRKKITNLKTIHLLVDVVAAEVEIILKNNNKVTYEGLQTMTFILHLLENLSIETQQVIEEEETQKKLIDTTLVFFQFGQCFLDKNEGSETEKSMFISCARCFLRVLLNFTNDPAVRDTLSKSPETLTLLAYYALCLPVFTFNNNLRSHSKEMNRRESIIVSGNRLGAIGMIADHHDYEAEAEAVGNKDGDVGEKGKKSKHSQVEMKDTDKANVEEEIEKVGKRSTRNKSNNQNNNEDNDNNTNNTNIDGDEDKIPKVSARISSQQNKNYKTSKQDSGSAGDSNKNDKKGSDLIVDEERDEDITFWIDYDHDLFVLGLGLLINLVERNPENRTLIASLDLCWYNVAEIMTNLQAGKEININNTKGNDIESRDGASDGEENKLLHREESQVIQIVLCVFCILKEENVFFAKEENEISNARKQRQTYNNLVNAYCVLLIATLVDETEKNQQLLQSIMPGQPLCTITDLRKKLKQFIRFQQIAFGGVIEESCLIKGMMTLKKMEPKKQK